MRRTPTSLAVLVLAAGFVAGPATPADALCAGAFADQPTVSRDSLGRWSISGYGGGRYCNGSATVCLDHNVVTTVSTTCRNYTGSPNEGPTGSVPCANGVWQTWVVVTPADGSRPLEVHSSSLVVTPLTCTSVNA